MPNEAHIIALAGNPNVGKSTVFNALTGLRQHTGNWPGKTVAAARGDLTYGGERFTLVDLPGTYSLFPNSAEEEIARDYLCSGEAEAVLILADATCLERSLNLVLQTLEAADVPAVVCVNLFDEAAKKGIVLEPNHVARPFPLIKSTNYLFGLIPLSKAQKVNFETLYITPEGEITEAMSSNFFLCKEGKIITAPVGKVLKGVTRDIIITLARENGFTVEERCPLEKELAEADEAFITGTVKEILPVVRVGAQQIGGGRPGPVAQNLQHIFLKNQHRWMD